jgi:pimeloyl-ACP methyl ester carboxylesterase
LTTKALSGGPFSWDTRPISRPRILLIPSLTEIEWQIKPLLAEWAEVASFDMPGVGQEPPAAKLGREALLARGAEELERLGWDRCVIAGDEFGTPTAIAIASEDPGRVAGLALGHACLDLTESLNQEVFSAFFSLAEKDYRTYVRALTQVTQDAYDDELADAYRERIPQEVALEYIPVIREVSDDELEPAIRGLGVPLLLAEHADCLGWTAEGYQRTIAAFPEAMTFSTPQKCSVSPAFAEALREFCAGLDWAT